MVDSLKKLDNESALRSFLRIISLTDLSLISERRHGLLADFCFRSLNSGFSAIAVKAYSMEILYRLSLIYPELATELSVSIRYTYGRWFSRYHFPWKNDYEETFRNAYKPEEQSVIIFRFQISFVFRLSDFFRTFADHFILYEYQESFIYPH